MVRIVFGQHGRFTDSPTMGPWVRRITGRPAWVWSIALGGAAIVMLVPVILMMVGLLAAVIVFSVLYSLLSGVAAVLEFFGLGPRDDDDDSGPSGDGGQRRNVEVVD